MHTEAYELSMEGMCLVLLVQSYLISALNNAQVTMCFDGNNYTVKLAANRKLLTPYA